MPDEDVVAGGEEDEKPVWSARGNEGPEVGGVVLYPWDELDEVAPVVVLVVAVMG